MNLRSRPFPCRSLAGPARTASLFLALATALSASAQVAQLELVPEKAVPILGGYVPQRLTLETNTPAALKRPPADLKTADARYGSLPFGPHEAKSALLVLVEEPASGPRRLWIDANANGDLSDDPAVEWKSRDYKSRDGKPLAMYSGGTKVAAKHADQELAVALQFYRFDPADPDRAQLKDTLLYYGDYARRGTVDLGGRKVPALLCDDAARGDFRGAKEASGPGARLALDLDGDGQFDRRPWESFDTRKPFTVAGTTWEITNLTWSGSSLRLAKSSQSVPEIKPPAPLNPGDSFPKFEAKTLGGKEVKFPGTYAGRLVLLDFWATWCGPCLGELPNLKSAYAEFHSRGIDILGVSLDDAGAADRVAAFLKKQDIGWDQIFEGGGWQTRLAKQFGIDSIPRVFLVDGDSGKILATTERLRGPNLSTTLKEQLEKRAGGGEKK